MPDKNNTTQTPETAATETVDEQLRVVTFEDLQKSHKDKAAQVYDQIAREGGFGDLGGDYLGGRPPLVLDGFYANIKDAESNPERSEDARHRLSEIKKLLK